MKVILTYNASDQTLIVFIVEQTIISINKRLTFPSPLYKHVTIFLLHCKYHFFRCFAQNGPSSGAEIIAAVAVAASHLPGLHFLNNNKVKKCSKKCNNLIFGIHKNSCSNNIRLNSLINTRILL